VSVAAIRWAAEQIAGGPMPKLVLYVLAEHANRDGTAHTSLATLARDTEASRSTVVRALDTLTDCGLISRTRRQRGTGADTSNEYRLRLDRAPENAAETAAGSAADGGTPTSRTGGHSDTPEGHTGTPPVSERHPRSVRQTPHAGATVTPQCEPELQNRTTEPKSSLARPRTRGTTTLADLSATAVRPDAYRLVSAWRTETGVAYRPAIVRALAKHADGILRDGGDPAAVRAALDAWHRRPDARPGLLPHLYDDAVKARHHAGRTPAGGLSPRDAKAAGWFALAAEFAAEDTDTTPATSTSGAVDVEVLTLDGGRS
jgi:DNA-binding transcriptional ArsR family regulator